uniref:Voltage-gated ion channel superfamily n=1 Tax=Tetraselmis sp. GSL018 TaxID=582737 RepID=A0A061QR06_9CHLO|mmetsp:Transcript_26028/g.61927  ORF Transcript_26028/g.61927 Transcript_26028/m.61927 type:complete len:496 (-) Transcript_26028:213-1700(-)|eukprot:CAMPEP_0177612864 /NCGR_PEP_ID=MMETSP0419_2-20121207/21556_1 /TAXON_ID=582737 /ORGANISM="Tetraselmis sp., Strain GSL018" /LENGTH=495 /DNA_ID=CAMNT_0019109297 /DNA_START=550 /DNA_END=2037 /DNA_ORIENTATION=+
MGIPLFLTTGGRTKRVDWSGKSFEELAKIYCEAFSIEKNKDIEFRRGHFYLRHPDFGIYYEGFELEELVPGSVLEVRGPYALASGPTAWEVDLDPTTRELSLDSDDDSSDSGAEDGDLDDGLLQRHEDSEIIQADTLRSKIWNTLDNPNYSRLSRLYTVFIMLVITVSTVTFVTATLPMFHVAARGEKGSVWHTIEATCVAIFTAELVLRVACAPPELLSLRPLRLGFFRSLMNLVDILAIVPFYLELILHSASVPGLAVLRVVRLVRIFRLFKVSKGAATIFSMTMRKSAKPLYMLVFFTSLALIVFSTIMFFAERGTFDPELLAWKRVVDYTCVVEVKTVNSGGGSGGRWLEQLDAGLEDGAGCTLQDSGPTARRFDCTYAYLYDYSSVESTVFEGERIEYYVRKYDCMARYEISPFESIPASMWWCLVTMTTVGYGDVVPLRWYGKIVGIIVMLSGILVIALPITVIGSNFADVYRALAVRKQGLEGAAAAS